VYVESDLLRVARRLGGKRNFLLVNPLQGKHMPVAPDAALDMMESLGHLLVSRCGGGKALFIGFAETATAIGAACAASYADLTGQDVNYIHTTRERIDKAPYFLFSEAHSHAVEQRLYRTNWERLTAGIDRIVFVEDELSTGETCLSLLSLLRREGAVEERVKFTAVSILNIMEDSAVERLSRAGLETLFLLKPACADFERRALLLEPDSSCFHDYRSCGEYDGGGALEIEGRLDPRVGVSIGGYLEGVDALARALAARLGVEGGGGGSLALLGTEEFMYPCLYAGRLFGQLNPRLRVRCHASTRTPIAAALPPSPIRSAHALCGVYEGSRETYLYNSAPYDSLVVLSDAAPPCGEGVEGLRRIFADAGCGEFRLALWKT